MRGEIYQPAAQANSDFICLCARVDSYILTMCVTMPRCVSMHLYETFFLCVCCLHGQWRLIMSQHQFVFVHFFLPLQSSSYIS